MLTHSNLHTHTHTHTRTHTHMHREGARLPAMAAKKHTHTQHTHAPNTHAPNTHAHTHTHTRTHTYTTLHAAEQVTVSAHTLPVEQPASVNSSACGHIQPCVCV